MSTHDKTGSLNLASELGVLRQETITGMDHLGAMLNGDLDDLVAGKISTNGSVLPALSNHVCLVGLCNLTVNPQWQFERQELGEFDILCLCIERRSS